MASGSWRRADVQGLRGIAVLLVVLYHAGLDVPGGFTGVDVFFVISGFVITGLLLRELDASGSLDLRRFYARRIRRLLPALAVMLTVVAAVGLLASPVGAQVTTAHTGIAASLFAANAYLYRLGTGYFDVRTTLDPLLHTWTLGVEEQFYLVFPALLLAAWRVARGSPRLVASIAVIAVSALSFGLALTLSGNNAQFAFYGSPTRAWEFGAGAVLALATPWVSKLGSEPLRLLGVAGVALVGAGAFLIRGTQSFAGWQMLLPVAGAISLIAAGSNASGPATRLLSTRPLVWVGNLSYSWYLWHWPAIVFARALLPSAPVTSAAAAASLVPAWLSFRYVESRFRRNGSGHVRPTWLLAAACVTVPILAAAVLLGAHHLLSQTTALKRWHDSEQAYLSARAGCEALTPLGERTSPRWSACASAVAHPRGELVLVGDSNAAQFSEPVIHAGNRVGYDVTIAPLGTCPFADLRVFGTAVGEPDCDRFDSASLAALVRRRPRIVVIANRDDLMISLSRIGLAPSSGGSIAYSLDAKERVWTQGLRRTLDRLNRAGVRVLLIRPVPLMQTPPGNCAVIRVLTMSCSSSVSRSAVAAELGPTDRAERRASLRLPLTSIANFEDYLCGRTRCATISGKTILYRDADHLSVAGARTLTGVIERSLLSLTQR